MINRNEKKFVVKKLNLFEKTIKRYAIISMINRNEKK